MALPNNLEKLDQLRLQNPTEAAEQLLALIEDLSDTRELALALGIYGSCKRHLGMVGEAIEVLGRALDLASDEWDRAHILQRRSMAISATGDFDRAFAQSDQAFLGYLHAGDFDYMGRVLVDQAKWWYHLESYAKCVEANDLALRMLASRNIAFRFTCHQGSALAFVEVGDTKACLSHLELAAPLAEGLGSAAYSRFLWTKAKLCEQTGRSDLAEVALRRVRDMLWETGEAFDAALSSVSLIKILLTQNKTKEAEAEAIACRRFLVHLPESNSAVPILAAIWKQAEAKSLSLAFVQSAIRQMAGAETAPAQKT